MIDAIRKNGFEVASRLDQGQGNLDMNRGAAIRHNPALGEQAEPAMGIVRGIFGTVGVMVQRTDGEGGRQQHQDGHQTGNDP